MNDISYCKWSTVIPRDSLLYPSIPPPLTYDLHIICIKGIRLQRWWKSWTGPCIHAQAHRHKSHFISSHWLRCFHSTRQCQVVLFSTTAFQLQHPEPTGSWTGVSLTQCLCRNVLDRMENGIDPLRVWQPWHEGFRLSNPNSAWQWSLYARDFCIMITPESTVWMRIWGTDQQFYNPLVALTRDLVARVAST